MESSALRRYDPAHLPPDARRIRTSTNVGTVHSGVSATAPKTICAIWRAKARRSGWCKGAYLEPENVAFPEKAEVDAQLRRDHARLSASAAPGLFADRHPRRESDSRRLKQIDQEHQPAAGSLRIPDALRHSSAPASSNWQQAGYQVRIYVPFGEAWYPYFMRRLAERPANLWFFVRSIFRA